MVNGKSTLLKAILGICDFAIISGSINTNNKRIGYLEQSMNEEHLNNFKYIKTQITYKST